MRRSSASASHAQPMLRQPHQHVLGHQVPSERPRSVPKPGLRASLARRGLAFSRLAFSHLAFSRHRAAALALLALLALLFTPAMLLAQSPNFITPGEPNRSEGVADQEILNQRVNEAPWRLGIFRFSPWIGVRDASFVNGNNVGDGSDQTNDFTVTVGAGVRGYLHAGSKFVLASQFLPEFTYWVDSSERNRLNGRYGLAIFGYFNRFDLELSHRHTQQQGFFSSEVQRLTPTRNLVTRAIGDIQLSNRLYLTLRGIRTSASSAEDEGSLVRFLAQLDRTEDTFQALIGYRAPGGWRFSLGYEDTSVDFGNDARPLSNDSSGLIVEAGFAGNRFDGTLELAFRDLEPAAGSAVRAAHETTGLAEAIWVLSARSALLTYGRRSLEYSVSTGASYFIGDRVGARWQAVWDRIGLGVWAETGQDTFASLAGSSLLRTDDVTSFGLEGSIAFKSLRLLLSLQNSDFSSPGDAFDRDITTVGFSFQIEPLEKLLNSASDRLRVGAAGTTW